MEKQKRKKIKILGFRLKDLIQLGTILGVFFWGWQQIEGKFDNIDRQFEAVDRRFEKVDQRFEKVDQHFEHLEGQLDNIESELKRTSDLLDLYLTWRFIYVNDPVRKNLVPVYDPRSRTLEFVSKK